MATETPDDRYEQVYRATYDAVWTVIGEVVYALFLAILFLVGLDIVVVSLMEFAVTPTAVVFVLLGVVLVAITVHRFAKLFDLLPWP